MIPHNTPLPGNKPARSIESSRIEEPEKGSTIDKFALFARSALLIGCLLLIFNLDQPRILEFHFQMDK